MSDLVPGHSAPAAGFEVPLEMLSACHYRIESLEIIGRAMRQRRGLEL